MAKSDLAGHFDMEFPPTTKENNWDFPHAREVYMPMLSISELSTSDLKLHEQWIIRRKRIIYFLTMLTIAAVCFCAISTIYVLPQMYGGEGEVPSKSQGILAQLNTLIPKENFSGILQQDIVMSPEGSKGFPTLEEEDVNELSAPSTYGVGDDGNYQYCILSPHEESRKFTNSCNAIVFREVDDHNLSHYYPNEGFEVKNIEYVRISSPLSENLVYDVSMTFSSMQKLTVSIDKLCYGSEQKDRNHLPDIYLPELKTLEIVNATLCPLTSWLFTKWDMPLIQEISIIQADIPPQVFESLNGFIQSHNDTLTTVQFVDCFLGDCDVANIRLFHNLTIVQTHLRSNSLL